MPVSRVPSLAFMFALARTLSACTSPADAVNDAPTLTFEVRNATTVDFSLGQEWLEIEDDGYRLQPYSGPLELCDEDIHDYGVLPPPKAQIAPGERHAFAWKENAFTFPGDKNNWISTSECQNVERVPEGAHTFTVCARARDLSCRDPSGGPTPAGTVCVTTTPILTDESSSQVVVFGPETYCPGGVEND